MAGHVEDIIVAAGKSWRTGNGGVMQRRFQAGGIRKRGRRTPVWEGRYYEPVLVAGKLKKVRRAVILGLCSEITKGKAKRKFQEILRPLNEGLVSPAQAMTFADFCARWKKDILETIGHPRSGFTGRHSIAGFSRTSGTGRLATSRRPTFRNSPTNSAAIAGRCSNIFGRP